jgi:hypothetical protein
MLTADQLTTATRLYPRLRARDPSSFDAMIRAMGIDPRAPVAEVVQAVAAWQAAHPPLVADGVPGVKTSAVLRGETWQPPDGDEYLIVGGKRVLVRGIRVVTWQELGGLSFYGQPGWTKRTAVTDLFVAHHDAARFSHGCHQTLLARDLAVHLMLDGDGTVYQALDLAGAEAYHAKGVNPRSVGVEINNPVDPKLDNPAKPRPRVKVGWKQYGNPNAIMLGLHPSQIFTLLVLADAITSAFGIPRRLPTQAAPGWDAPDPRVASGEFSGVCFHGHVTEKKWDPSGATAQLRPAFRDAGYSVG